MKTIQRIIEIPLDEVRSEKFQSNIKKYGMRNSTCIICGKPILNIDKAKSVNYLNNGNIVSYDGTDIEGSQGGFLVGADCAKKLIIQFAF